MAVIFIRVSGFRVYEARDAEATPYLIDADLVMFASLEPVFIITNAYADMLPVGFSPHY